MHDHGGLCPECNGSGYLAFYGPNEGDRTELRHAIACYSCHDGVITTIPTEEEVSLARLVHHIMPGPYGPTKVYREDMAEYERWLDSL